MNMNFGETGQTSETRRLEVDDNHDAEFNVYDISEKIWERERESVVAPQYTSLICYFLFIYFWSQAVSNIFGGMYSKIFDMGLWRCLNSFNTFVLYVFISSWYLEIGLIKWL